MKLKPFSSLRHLRLFLGKSQKEFANEIAGCSKFTIESLESNPLRLKLSTRLAFKISESTGCDVNWLLSNSENLPMTNANGRDYSLQDWEDARDADLESLKFYRVEPEMEIGVAADLLHRVLDAARKRDIKALSDFQKRLEHYVRSEISRFRDLQDEVYQEIRQWGERNVATGKSYPKNFLFPRSLEPFKRGKKRADKAIAAIEKRLKPIKK
jgi:DNA-binding XRE family transcriptional regulator